MSRPERELPDAVMTNFDHSIDEKVAEQLKAKPDHYAQYSGWNFCGYVWWEGQWACEVWVAHSPQEIIRAPGLNVLMHEVSDRYGWD